MQNLACPKLSPNDLTLSVLGDLHSGCSVGGHVNYSEPALGLLQNKEINDPVNFTKM